MRRSGHGLRAAATLLALALAVAAAVTGVVSGGPAPAAADCGTQFPDTRIGPHRGFAFEGVIRSVEQVPGQFLDRITMDVTELLVGDPLAEVVFDLGRGDCWFLQGDRYKVGDRLIVTASAPPIDGVELYLPDAPGRRSGLTRSLRSAVAAAPSPGWRIADQAPVAHRHHDIVIS